MLTGKIKTKNQEILIKSMWISYLASV
uniref:Uncharacterized protein n=1 Tax=Rhizophora mucronata TaxID=61149 RepID=A0A2P2PKN4_RHIMU